MKKFSFPLKAVLTVRRFRKNLASQELNLAEAHASRIESDLLEANEALSQFANALECQMANTTIAGTLLQNQNLLRIVREELDGLTAQLGEAQEKVASSRKKLAQSLREEEVIKTLKLNYIEKFRREQEKEEDRLALEFHNASPRFKEFQQ